MHILSEASLQDLSHSVPCKFCIFIEDLGWLGRSYLSERMKLLRYSRVR